MKKTAAILLIGIFWSSILNAAKAEASEKASMPTLMVVSADDGWQVEERQIQGKPAKERTVNENKYDQSEDLRRLREYSKDDEEENKGDRLTANGSPRKSAVTACILSLVIPGGGQFYNGSGLEGDSRQKVKGVFFLGASIGILVAAINRNNEPSRGWDASWDKTEDIMGYMIALGIIGGISAIDAAIIASSINSGTYKLPEKKVSLKLNKDRMMLCYNVRF